MYAIFRGGDVGQASSPAWVGSRGTPALLVGRSALTLALFLGGAFVCAATADITEIRIHPETTKQVIWGLGFEIQSDSIGSGNQGLPDNRVAVPHDLTPAERQRFYDEMLQGFRYCRLAGGLYWRGLDAEGKFLRPRWPGQLAEIREMLQVAGVEGVSFEYWSPAPFWKANRSYVSRGRDDVTNTLRCFGPDFAKDPIYRGDVDRFLADFADAVVSDIKTLRAAGIPTSMWGLQNEPWFSHGPGFSTCGYPDAASYVKAYRAVASAVRRYDARILLFADTESNFPRQIATAIHDPEIAGLVDAYVVHTIGAPSEHVREVHRKIRTELPWRPWFQNEYEYLHGGATPERCLNTVQHIMNSFQLAENPTWFWIHALKPFKNAEASGYSLGFWNSLAEPVTKVANEIRRRWQDGPELAALPNEFEAWEMISATRGDPAKPGAPYDFSVNQPVIVHLLVEDFGGYTPGADWEPTKRRVSWTEGEGRRDVVYRRAFSAGKIDIPMHTGKSGGRFGAPHLVFVEPSEGVAFKAMIGVNVPIQIRSEFIALEREAAKLKPGHWMFNRYNWHAVGSFVKRMPWDSVAVAVDETRYDADARVFAFLRPNGKLTVVLSNRKPGEHAFDIATGRKAVWHGFRYTPDNAGERTLGVAVGAQTGLRLRPVLPRLSWEFWEEQ
jgi:hypothetical protein